MVAQRVPLNSMTGFGRGTAEQEDLRIDVEVKGVNHRFLDVKLRLPGGFTHLEADLRKHVSRQVARGRVDIAVSLRSSRPLTQRVEIRRDLVGKYLEAVKGLKREFRLTGSIGLDRIVMLPGVVQIESDSEPLDGRGTELLMSAFEQALAAYDHMRRAEGARLETDLRDRLDAIEKETQRIEHEGRGIPERYANRLRERIASLGMDRPLDEVRFAQEVALLADRIDITEEIVRLKGYIDQARSTLDEQPGPVGKTLDFIMQEMNREATTITSKSESLTICRSALSIRSSVEKIREQVQNIE